MNAESTPATAACPPPPPAAPAPAPSLPIPDLLKTPERLAQTIALGRGLREHAQHYLLSALAGYGAFGLSVGLFGGTTAGVMAMGKVPLVALAAFALCMPSLYVFSCIGGTALSAAQLAVIGMACLAMTALLLAALAPVVWLFAMSTSAPGFMVVLALAAWAIGMLFTSRFVGHLRRVAPLRQTGGIRVWLLLLTLTAMQMITTLRPILQEPRAGWRTPEKKFFVAHFLSCFDTQPHR